MTTRKYRVPIESPNPDREAKRAELAAQVAEFQRRGGKIERLPMGEPADVTQPYRFNASHLSSKKPPPSNGSP